MALLEIENLHVSYGSVEVLHGISLHVDEGEIVTLLGANGAGKSTTLLSISRLVNPREGRITFDGKNLLDYESYQVVGLGVAQSPEGRRVFGTMTVQENLMLGAFQVHSETITQNTLAWSVQLFPRWQARFPAANSRCWPWAGPSWPSRGSCSLTSRPWVSPRFS